MRGLGWRDIKREMEREERLEKILWTLACIGEVLLIVGIGVALFLVFVEITLPKMGY
jgi:hypothetical protein